MKKNIDCVNNVWSCMVLIINMLYGVYNIIMYFCSLKKGGYFENKQVV